VTCICLYAVDCILAGQQFSDRSSKSDAGGRRRQKQTVVIASNDRATTPLY